MFVVLVPSHPAKSGLFRAPRAEVQPAAGLSGSVTPDRLAVFAHLGGQAIRCLAGHLWVTLENDPMDHVLKEGQRLFVPTDGKVVVGGQGRYRL
jgi:hypothetical protein